MNHLSDERLNEFLDGLNPPEELQEIQCHLSQCSDCRERLAVLNWVVRSLEELGDVTLGRDLVPEIKAKIQRKRLSIMLEILLSIQAGLALGVLIFFANMGWQLLKVKENAGYYFLLQLNKIDLHFLNTTSTVHPAKFVSLPLPAFTLVLLALGFTCLLIFGNLHFLDRKIEE